MITRETSLQFTGFKVFEYQLGQLLFDNQWISYYFDAGTEKLFDNSNEIALCPVTPSGGVDWIVGWGEGGAWRRKPHKIRTMASKF